MLVHLVRRLDVVLFLQSFAHGLGVHRVCYWLLNFFRLLDGDLIAILDRLLLFLGLGGISSLYLCQTCVKGLLSRILNLLRLTLLLTSFVCDGQDQVRWLVGVEG